VSISSPAATPHGLDTSYDTAGAVTTYQRDGGGRVRRVTDPAGLETELDHDALDNLVRIGAPAGATSTTPPDLPALWGRFVDFDGTSVDYTFSPSSCLGW
jgi:YD repeat-containing protein